MSTNIPSIVSVQSASSSNDETLSNLHIDRSFITSAKRNVAASIDHDRRSTVVNPGDKLHRRNPVAVRQEIQFYDDLMPETTLSDLQLNEMPGLQNTEQWKRIAGRIGQASPPLSRQYCQTVSCLFDTQNGYIPEVLGSYRRPGRLENEQEIFPAIPALFRTSRRKILFGFLCLVTIIGILIAVVVAVIIVRKPHQTTTDYYSGTIVVRTRFVPMLLSPLSTLAKNYKREFCSLLSTTLVDMKTKYAIFYSSCSMDHFRNGSIVGDFTLGFTRYQNVTRLNAFLTRTLVNKQLFGGTILSIIFNSTADVAINNTDYDEDYNANESTDSLNTNQTTHLDGYIYQSETVEITTATIISPSPISDTIFIQSTNQKSTIFNEILSTSSTS